MVNIHVYAVDLDSQSVDGVHFITKSAMLAFLHGKAWRLI
jgi:hypothetical protein